MKKIKTEIINIYKDSKSIDLSSYKGTMDVSFQNLGTTVATINTPGGKVVISPGDPLLTWGGYQGYFRTDIFTVTFAGGSGNLVLYMNQHYNMNDC